jgi:hypothetical protein
VSNSTRPSNSSTTTSSYDERFVVPLEASRRGAHRARVSPVMAVLPVAAVVGIVIGAIALVYLFLGGMGGTDNATTTVASPSSASPTAAASTAGAAAPSSTPSDMATGTASAGAVDKMVTVAVYNGTSPTVSGLARKASTKLSTAGWTLGKVETWTGTPVTETTVFYGTEAQHATAMAIAKSLGRGVAKLSATKAGTGIAVVIGNDYPGAGAARPTGMTSTHAAGTRTNTAGGMTTHTTKAPAKAATKAAASTTATPSTDTATPTTSTTAG